MAESEATKSKLIIDEDWKAQAQAEKEALAKEKAAPAAASAASPPQPAPPDEAAASEDDQQHEHPPLPPASLPALISTLATQAMVALGQIAHPMSGKAEVDLDYARFQIDTLAVLDEKTRGNRTPQETQMLDAILHDLRMVHVALRDQAAKP